MALLKMELDKLIDTYKDHRQGYDEILEEMERVEKRYDELVKEFLLDGTRKDKATAKKNAELKVLNEELKALRDSFKNERDDILAGIENTFGYNYRVHPEMLDDNVIRLLEKGVYKDSELIGLYNEYAESGNLAMVRYIAKYGESVIDSGKVIERSLANRLRAMQLNVDAMKPEYAEIATGLAEVCNRCMGIRDGERVFNAGNPFSKPAHELATAWAKNKFEEFSMEYLGRADGITDKMPLQPVKV